MTSSAGEPDPPGAATATEPAPERLPREDRDAIWRARVGGAAILAFSVVWIGLTFLAEGGLYGSPGSALNVNLYARYASHVVDGQLPYRDFAFEYPPLALVPLLVPTLFTGVPFDGHAYRIAFEVVIAAIGMATMAFVVRTAGALALPRRAMLATAFVVAASPILLGPLMLARYDMWPAMFGAGALFFFVIGRDRLAAVSLGCAVLAKVYPLVIAPFLLLYLWRRHGLRSALQFGLVMGATVAIGVAPFLVLAPDGVIEAFVRAFQRPLHVESLGGSLLYAANVVTGLAVRMVHNYDSYNLAGGLPDTIATAQTVVLAGALIAAVALLVRRQITINRVVIAAAAAIAAFVAFGKVLSPQYLMWLIPPLAIVGARRIPVHLVLLAVAVLLTGIYYPRWYADYFAHREPFWVAIVLARNLVLAALVVSLLFQLVPGEASADAGPDDETGRAPQVGRPAPAHPT